MADEQQQQTPPSDTPTQKPPEAVAPAGDGTGVGEAPTPPRPRPARAAAGDGEAAAPAEGAPAPRAKPAEAAAEKPLADYLKEDLQPLLLKRMQDAGATDVQITVGEAEVSASWDNGDKLFTLYFDEGNLEGRKTIASSRGGSRGSNVQMFMPPERGFKGVDAKQIVTMILQQFTTTLTWIQKKAPAAAAAAAKKPRKPPA
jgi:hypothetical protein